MPKADHNSNGMDSWLGRETFMGRRSRPWRRVFAAGACCAAAAVTPAGAQETSELITTALPYPSYVPVREDFYGLRLGSVYVRYDLDGSEQDDFGFRPQFNVGLYYPINDRQKLQVDVGVGYEWWANRSESERFFVAPNSHLDYLFRLGDVDMRLSNVTSTTSEASTRPEFAGGNNPTDISFNRINNATRLTAGWTPGRLSFSGSYGYGITRSLNNQFEFLDRDTHSLNATALAQITTPVSAGISVNYENFSYSDNVQNDGETLSIGPTVIWRPLRSLTLDAAVYYTDSSYSREGQIADTSEFSGATFNVGATHVVNRYVSQRASFGRSIDPGYQSNYTDDFTINYSALATISEKLTSNLGFAYRSISVSEGGEDADLFQVSLGAGYRVLERATLGLTYSINTRVSDDDSREYWENRVVLTASYRF
jgi:hypothetical protein